MALRESHFVMVKVSIKKQKVEESSDVNIFLVSSYILALKNAQLWNEISLYYSFSQ